ncbi:ABC transporter ATP-binding protein [Enterococcus sp. LJL128]|uniref:ABC transporter ATP-binding protein n=1 Tax=Enterococcus sp. LJL51 TaxID=3416656 RepID=UPI003CEC7A29
MKLEYLNLTKQFKDIEAVKNFSLTLTPGIYGLLGANGSGKSTLMNMTCGLLKPTSGEILFDGQPIKKIEDAFLEKIGYLPQRFGYYEEFSVGEFLRYMGLIKGMKSSSINQRIDEVLTVVGLKELTNRKMNTLSGGMKQRVGIAQAVINNPKILILDEPTVGLDPQERVNFRNLISNLADDRIVLLSTHIVSDVEYISDRIVIMKQGQILLESPTHEAVNIVQNKVWLATVNQQELAAIPHLTIANIHYSGDTIQLRIISEEQPLENAELTEPVMEDVYLYYFKEKSEERISNDRINQI